MLTNHREIFLVINGKKATKTPVKGSNVHFTRHHKQLVAPFVIYADFESNLKKFQEKKKKEMIQINLNIILLVNIENENVKVKMKFIMSFVKYLKKFHIVKHY